MKPKGFALVFAMLFSSIMGLVLQNLLEILWLHKKRLLLEKRKQDAELVLIDRMQVLKQWSLSDAPQWPSVGDKLKETHWMLKKMVCPKGSSGMIKIYRWQAIVSYQNPTQSIKAEKVFRKGQCVLTLAKKKSSSHRALV